MRTCGRESLAPRAGAVAAAKHNETSASAFPISPLSKLIAKSYAERPRSKNRVTAVDECFWVDVHDAVAIAEIFDVQRSRCLADTQSCLEIDERIRIRVPVKRARSALRARQIRKAIRERIDVLNLK